MVASFVETIDRTAEEIKPGKRARLERKMYGMFGPEILDEENANQPLAMIATLTGWRVAFCDCGDARPDQGVSMTLRIQPLEHIAFKPGVLRGVGGDMFGGTRVAYPCLPDGTEIQHFPAVIPPSSKTDAEALELYRAILVKRNVIAEKST